MFSKINLYLYKNYINGFIIVLLIFSLLTFTGDLIENFRKATTKFVPTVTRQKIGDKLLLDQRKKPDMLESDRRKLKEIYEEEVKKLEEMLKVKLPWNEFCN